MQRAGGKHLERAVMAKNVTLSDIAKKVGVSTVTVSKALSGQSGVSDSVRAQIKDLAESMGYQKRSRTTRKERTDEAYNIGVLIPEKYLDKYSSFYAMMYGELAAQAVKRGCFAFMEPITAEGERELRLPRMIEEDKADGIVIIGYPSDDYLEMLKTEGGLPVVYMDFSTTDENADAVLSNGYYGSYFLTNYLFGKGHKRIAFVGTVGATGSITDRYLGYMKAFIEHGCSYSDSMVIEDRDAETGNMDEEKFFQLPPEKDMPDAFVCNSDLTASMLIHKLRDNGYRVPDDVSVVGYDNYLYPGLCDIGITTYEVDVRNMAKRVLHILTHKIEGRPYQGGVQVVEGRLIEKDSVK